MEKSKLYTRTGDAGTTSLVGGTRVEKKCARLEAYGTIDELNSWIGMLAVDLDNYAQTRPFKQLAISISCKLFDIGGYLATDPKSEYVGFTSDPISQSDISRLEEAIDLIDSQLPRLNSFVLPGGTAEAARTHIARSVCRRTERRILAIVDQNIDQRVTCYINRLSDLLFAMARFFVFISENSEIFWSKDC